MVFRLSSFFCSASQAMERGLVSPAWVVEGLKAGNPRLRIVDATWFLPNSPFACPVEGASAEALFARGPRLPGASFFDLDAVADSSSGLPHMLPTGGVLAKALAELGISKESDVVVYDQLGMFSAPRFWYTLKAFGHPSVAVLDGGLPGWLQVGGEVQSTPPADTAPVAVPEETWTLNPSMVWSLQQAKANISERAAQVIDARPGGRFLGTTLEPRPGMRSGHMPGSVSVPFAEVLTSSKTMKSQDELLQVFAGAGVLLRSPSMDASESWIPPFLVTSCGSGMTAAILGLALNQLSFPIESNWALYDGSWMEYGGRSDTEVVKTGPDGEEVSQPPLDPKL